MQTSTWQFVKAALVMALGFQWLNRVPWLFWAHFATAALFAVIGADMVGNETRKENRWC